MQRPNQTLLRYLRFLILLIAVSVISATAPVLGIEKPEDNTLFVSGFEAYQHKDYIGALKSFNSLLERYPDSPLQDVAMFWTSRAYYKTGNQMESARYMSRLIKQYPNTPIRGFVKNEMLDLVSRFEHGEQLPTKTAQAKAVLSAPTSHNTQEPKRSEPATGIRSAASTGSAEKKIADSIMASPANFSRNVHSVPAAQFKQTATATLVKDIKTGASYIDIVTGSSLEDFKSFKLLSPGRLVVDLPHAKSALAAKSISINRLGISKVRIGNDRDTVRIVLDVEESPFPVYDVKPFKNGLRISVAPSAALMTTAASLPASAQTSTMKQKLPETAPTRNAVFIKEIKAGESYIDIVTGSSLEEFKTFKLLSPGRMVIDLPHAKSALAAKSISINRLGISKVRIGTDSDTVRIVLDVEKSPFPAYDVKPFQNGLRISVAPSAAFKTAAVSVPASAQTSKMKQKLPVTTPTKNAVFIKKITAGESFIDIVTGSRLESYKSFILHHPDRLVIDIPGAKRAVSSKSVSINRMGISTVRTGIDRTTVRIVLDATQSQLPEYEIRPTENGLRIYLG